MIDRIEFPLDLDVPREQLDGLNVRGLSDVPLSTRQGARGPRPGSSTPPTQR
jgi:hypothetical protein